MPPSSRAAESRWILTLPENLFIRRRQTGSAQACLQKSYYGQVKMIYIDPPYNTGKGVLSYPG